MMAIFKALHDVYIKFVTDWYVYWRFLNRNTRIDSIYKYYKSSRNIANTFKNNIIVSHHTDRNMLNLKRETADSWDEVG